MKPFRLRWTSLYGHLFSMRKTRRFFFLIVLGFGRAVRLSFADELPQLVPHNNEPIVLPRQIVLEPRFDQHPWLYAKADGIEVLTKLYADESRAYAENFWQAEQMFGRIVPESVWARSKKPVILVICPGTATTANADALRELDVDRMKELVSDRPLPGDAFAAAQRFLLRRNNSNAEQQLVSYYDQEATVFFNRRTNPEQSTVNFSAGNQGADVMLGRSLYRTLAERRAPPLPPWLAEALPAVLAASHLNSQNFSWEIDPFTVWPDEKGAYPQTKPKQILRLLPLSQVFAVPPPARGTREFALWSYSSALFVRWAFGKAALWNFVADAMRHGVSEELFQRCFGCSYDDAEEQCALISKRTWGGNDSK